MVNGWCLARKYRAWSAITIRNSLDTRREHTFYDRYSLPAGIITADKVRLSKISLDKGNLIRVIIKGEDKSYVIPDTTDSNFGITGWISNNSYTTDFDRVYFNQAYLKSRSIVYSEPDPNSSHVSDFTDYMARTGTDAFVNLTGKLRTGSFMSRFKRHVRLGQGTGYIPSAAEQQYLLLKKRAILISMVTVSRQDKFYHRWDRYT